jgi:hypothetical protein
MKIYDRHCRNKALEVTNSDVQDSVSVIGKGTASISIVTNNGNDVTGQPRYGAG